MASFWWRLLCAILLLCPATALAETFEHGLSQLASEDFVQVATGITTVGNSGHPRALEVLESLERRQLAFDESRRVFIKKGTGFQDPVSGEPAEPKGALTNVNVNNQVRRVLAPMISRLRLLSPKTAIRRAAAEELLKRPQEAALEVMRGALEQEKDGEIRAMLGMGIARLELSSQDKERRLSAIVMIRAQADVSLKSELEALLRKNEAGEFVEQDADIRREAQAALKSIDNRVFMISMVANTFYGLSLGSILLLAALGLAITFGLMRVINMAHGEMLMLGAYSTFVVQNFFIKTFPASTDWYLAAAIPVAFLVCAVVGMALERLVVRHLYGRPLETLLATWGISLILIQTVRLIFGAQNVTVANPSWLSGGFELMPTLVMPYSRLAIVAFTVLIVLGVSLLLQRTSFGLQIRAVTQNRAMAASMGIPAKRVDLLTFGLGSGLAGLGGVALSQLGNVGPELGQSYIVDSFMVVVLGGVGKLVGTVLGAFGLGLLNKYVEPMTGAVLGKIIILVMIVLFIQKRPQGLFALKGRAAEV